jgi:hypothetical protein
MPASAAAGHGGAVVRALSPAEQRYLDSVTTINEWRRDLTILEYDFTMLRDAIADFEALAQARLGDLFTQLRQLESETADYSHRLSRLRAAIDALSPEDYDPLDALEDDEILHGPQARNANGRGRQRGPHMPEATRRWLATEATEAKRLYIDLAKRLHPDLARDDDDRQRRERIMQRVNEAFRLRDLSGLRAIHLESIADDPKWEERPVTERLAWADAELERLEVALKDVRSSLTRLRSGELYRLYNRHESGDPVFSDLKTRIEGRIESETRRLERMKTAYRRLVDHWREMTAVGAGRGDG